MPLVLPLLAVFVKGADKTFTMASPSLLTSPYILFLDHLASHFLRVIFSYLIFQTYGDL